MKKSSKYFFLITLFLLLAFNACENNVGQEKRNEKEYENVTIEVGTMEEVGVRQIVYLGMDSNRLSFSLSTGGYHDSLPFWYPLNKEEVLVYYHRFKVIEVSPNSITLKYIGEK